MSQAASLFSRCRWVHDPSIVNGTLNVRHLPYMNISNIPAVDRMALHRHPGPNAWKLQICNI